MILSKQYLNELVAKNKQLKYREFKAVKKKKFYDIFLSYSFNDKNFAIIIFNLLEKCGYSVYIDLMDPKMNRSNVNKTTAVNLSKVMDKCKGLIYIHSNAAKVSKWCPWELGYFSGKTNFMCATLPLIEYKAEKYKGQEYLNMYNKVQYGKEKISKKDSFWIYDQDNKYITLDAWLYKKQIGGYKN